jgi:hypothetical protein
MAMSGELLGLGTFCMVHYVRMMISWPSIMWKYLGLALNPVG